MRDDEFLAKVALYGMLILVALWFIAWALGADQ